MDDLRQLTLRMLDSQGSRLFNLFVRLTLSADAAEELYQELSATLVRTPKWAQARDPTGYVIRMAVNLAGQWRRDRKKRPTVVPPDLPATDLTPVEVLEHREELDRLLEAVAELPETMQTCLVMRYLEEQPPEVIGRQIGKSAHRVRSICSKALARLRRQLGLNEG